MKQNRTENNRKGNKRGSKDHELVHHFDDCVYYLYSKVNVNFVNENWLVPVGTNQTENNSLGLDFFV